MDVYYPLNNVTVKRKRAMTLFNTNPVIGLLYVAVQFSVICQVLNNCLLLHIFLIEGYIVIPGRILFVGRKFSVEVIRYCGESLPGSQWCS